MSLALSRRIGCILTGFLLVAVWQMSARADEIEATHVHEPQAPVSEAPARLIVDAPLPGPLARGALVLPFHAEYIQLLPVYGTEATHVTPRIGHLHLTLDNAAWHWVHASNDPLVIQGLDAGAHTLRVDLADPQHRVLYSQTVGFTIPQR